jgi:hypothetical protein
LPEGTIHSWD